MTKHNIILGGPQIHSFTAMDRGPAWTTGEVMEQNIEDQGALKP